jgi:hypothetical protein
MTPAQVEWFAERFPEARERFRDIPVDLHKRVRKYAFQGIEKKAFTHFFKWRKR